MIDWRLETVTCTALEKYRGIRQQVSMRLLFNDGDRLLNCIIIKSHKVLREKYTSATTLIDDVYHTVLSFVLQQCSLAQNRVMRVLYRRSSFDQKT